MVIKVDFTIFHIYIYGIGVVKLQEERLRILMNIKNIKSKCQVCNSDVLIDQFGNGICYNCGWKQNIACIDFPNRTMPPNISSLNNAKFNYKKNKKISPSFADFIDMLRIYGEVEFTIYDVRYGAFRTEDKAGKDIIELFIESGNVITIFKDIDDFEMNAKINGELLKDIWVSVTNVDYMQ